MAKVSRTKTHVKLYLTPNEMEALHDVFGEGIQAWTDDGRQTPAMMRVESAVNKALHEVSAIDARQPY